MKPEDLLDPANLPADLQWLATQYRLQPNDPVFLLIAWHWTRIAACEDTVRAAILEMKTALDARIDLLTDAATAVTGINAALGDLQTALEEKPKVLSAQFDAELRQPIATTVAQVLELEKSLKTAARTFQTARRRQQLATLLIGVALGVLSSAIVLLA